MTAACQGEVFKVALCPISGTPLLRAVTLLPCGHKVNEEALSKISKCPTCQAPIESYYKDDWTRSLVKMLLGIAKKGEVPPFPGKGAKFVLEEDDWKQSAHASDVSRYRLARSLVFKSETKGSFLTKMKVLGYVDGTVIICVEFLESPKAESYFRNMPMTAGSLLNSAYYAMTHDDMKILWDDLQKNNVIPKEYLPMIQKLVKDGRWR